MFPLNGCTKVVTGVFKERFQPVFGVIQTLTTGFPVTGGHFLGVGTMLPPESL